MTPTVLVKRLPHGADLPLPGYAKPGDAGMDLRAAVDIPYRIPPGVRAMIPTGISIALPQGYEAQVRPRSGLAVKHGISVVNSPGTIDAGYRGEVCVLLINHGDSPLLIERGDRIAQMVIAPVAQAYLMEAEVLPPSERAEGGFGSTGINSTI